MSFIICKEVLIVTYLMSAILGLVQGVAEFLPISSSGHLTLLQHFFGMEEPDQLFNILLHFATLLAVCIYYFQDVLGMILEFFSYLGMTMDSEYGSMAWTLVLWIGFSLAAPTSVSIISVGEARRVEE